MSDTKYCYSKDEERFEEDFDCVCDDAEFDAGEDGEQVITIYRGIPVPRSHSDYLDADYIFENMINAAYDAAPEFADDYLASITPEQSAELKALIVGWFDQNIEPPNWYGVKDVQAFTYTNGQRDELLKRMGEQE